MIPVDISFFSSCPQSFFTFSGDAIFINADKSEDHVGVDIVVIGDDLVPLLSFFGCKGLHLICGLGVSLFSFGLLAIGDRLSLFLAVLFLESFFTDFSFSFFEDGDDFLLFEVLSGDFLVLFDSDKSKCCEGNPASDFEDFFCDLGDIFCLFLLDGVFGDIFLFFLDDLVLAFVCLTLASSWLFDNSDRFSSNEENSCLTSEGNPLNVSVVSSICTVRGLALDPTGVLLFSVADTPFTNVIYEVDFDTGLEPAVTGMDWFDGVLIAEEMLFNAGPVLYDGEHIMLADGNG